MFEQVNKDCAESGEPVVDFSDVGFYANQIYNLTEEMDLQAASDIALQMCDEDNS